MSQDCGAEVGYTKLSLDPDGYTLSGSKASAADQQLESAGLHALHALSPLAHMGGDDEAGGQFAHAYDKQAVAIFTGLGALCSALSQTAAAFAASAASHANTEAANAGSSDAQTDLGPTVVRDVSFQHPASAFGGTNVFPEGWTFIQALVSATWPDGDTGKMRTAKEAWNALADDIDNVTSKHLATLLDPLHGFQAPDLAVIAVKTGVLAPAADELSQACRDLATACADYAEAVDHAHDESIKELQEFLITSMAAIGISALLTPFTAGISDLVGGAAVAADAAITAARIARVLGVLVERVAPILVRVGEASRAAPSVLSYTARAGLYVGKTAAVGSTWAVGSVTGDLMINTSKANVGDDIVYSLIAGGFAEVGKSAGEALTIAAKNGLSRTAAVAGDMAAKEAPEVLAKPAAEAVLDGPKHAPAAPKHAADPEPLKVVVTSAGIKTSTFLAGAGAGSVAGQAATTGVDPQKLPADISKDAAEGLIPVLDPPGLHEKRLPLPRHLVP
jgi:hypothetical protein